MINAPQDTLQEYHNCISLIENKIASGSKVFVLEPLGDFSHLFIVIYQRSLLFNDNFYAVSSMPIQYQQFFLTVQFDSHMGLS